MAIRCILCVLSSMIALTLMISLANGQEQMPVAQPDQDFNPAPIAPAPEAPQQGATNAPAKGTKTKVVYKEKSYYDFEDVLINGNVRAPDGSFIFRKNDTNFSSALNLKRSFIPELKESSNNAR